MVLQQQPQPPCTLQHPAMDWHPNSPNHKLNLFFHSNSHIPNSDAIATPAFSTSCIRSPTRRAPARHAARPDPVLDFHESMRKRRCHATGTLKAHDRLFEDRECMQLHSDNVDDVNPSSLRMHAGRDVDGGGKITTPLDPSLWKALPVEVIERIFACLPIASLFRFRAVCQSWNSAPLRLLFRALRAHVMIPETWLMMLAMSPPSVVQSRSASSAHGSSLSFVFNLSLSKPVVLNDTFLPFPPDSGQFSYCTNAGGLICYHYHTGFSANSIRKPVSLWVGNPFTKEWKCLPPMVGSFPLNFPLRGLVGMVVLDGVANDHVRTSQPTHYKIIVRTQNLHSWGSGMMTEEYDSHRNAWSVTTTANVPSDHRIEQVLHCNGSLYFLTWQVRDGIYVYHLANRRWSRLLPPKQHQFTSPHMVECCGHLVLVSGVGRYHTIWLKGVRQLHARTTGIKLWQLVEKDPPDTNAVMPVTTNAAGVPMMQHGSSWSSLSHMPDELVQEFVTGVQFHCTSIQNLIYLTNSISMLIFHVVPRLWRRVIVVQIPFLVQEFVSFMPKLEASP